VNEPKATIFQLDLLIPCCIMKLLSNIDYFIGAGILAARQILKTLVGEGD